MSFLVAGATVAGVVTVGTGIAGAISGASQKRKAKKANEKARAQMEIDKERYMNLDTSNPYLNMENTMEDLTVNTQAADFAAEQSQVGMANTLNNMKQAAGGSGIAALAQALANQGQIAAQKASVSIADQEMRNQQAERREASSIQNLEREGEVQSRNMKQGLASTALGLSAADVKQTASDINKANDQMWGSIKDIGTGVGDIFGGIG
tara:strand:- start:1924 stop:2547 length:624 start_codon:yes stop_codon:yes gene_type:complete